MRTDDAQVSPPSAARPAKRHYPDSNCQGAAAIALCDRETICVVFIMRNCKLILRNTTLPGSELPPSHHLLVHDRTRGKVNRICHVSPEFPPRNFRDSLACGKIGKFAKSDDPTVFTQGLALQHLALLGDVHPIDDDLDPKSTIMSVLKSE